MNIASDMTQLIGHTPLLSVDRLCAACGVKAEVLAKLEAFNPSGSVKDRAALFMIDRAEEDGRLKSGTTIVEPTSGNTGIGLAAIAALRGYRIILTMPESMSVERRNLLAAYGAELVLTPAKDGMNGAVARAEEIAAELGNAWIPRQFDNPDNPKAHELTTASEIIHDTDGKIAALVAGVGTGGTLTGTARGLKKKIKNLYAVAIEPETSPLLSGGTAGAHKIQGIGANFIPTNYDATVVDEVLTVSNEAAYDMCRMAVKTEGLLIGVSAAAALVGAFELAARPQFFGKRIVVVLPDDGTKYLSSGIFNVGE